jgi:DNA helicase-2/ATP-dependent DNA helicase PcrA
VAWSDGLTGPALEVAGATDSPLLALAGPGTGKTFSLVRRVTRFLEDGCPPDEVLVVTFARTAAQDLVRSLQPVAGTNLRARTVHAHCFSLLNSAQVLQTTGRTPRIAADFERDLLLADLGGQFGTLTDRRALAKAFEGAWARRQTDAPGQAVSGLDQAFQDAVIAALRWYGAMLVGELVPLALHYLRMNPSAPERRAFQHVVVDEYQDLNRAEQELIELISGAGTLTVIGDDDQSIYSFKWANPEGIRTFEASHPGTRRVPIEECRRCPTTVVQMAATLIARDPTRLPHALRPRPTNPPGEVHVVQWTSIAEESEGIATYLASKIGPDVTEGDCLVLAPNRIVGYGIRDAMRAVGISTRSFFRQEPLDNEAAQEAFTLIQLLANPDDRLALRAWLSFGSSTQRRGPYRRALAAARDAGVDVSKVLSEIASGRRQLPYSSELVARWNLLQARLAALHQVPTLAALVDEMLPDGIEPVEDLRTLAVDIVAGAPDVRTLADELRSSVSQPQVPLESEEARVMSFYKSKGLTAKIVVLAGLVQGLLPATREGTQQEREADYQEQRRLFYVGLTRTTQALVLSSYATLSIATAMRVGAQRGRFLGQGQVQVFASDFLRELGPRMPQPLAGSRWEY